MKNKIIMTIVGARPQFIKASVVSLELKKQTQFKEILIHTGQHYDKEMSEVFFHELKLNEPNYNLKINKLRHGAMTGKMLIEIEKLILKHKPNLILVYGDTNSTLAGALAAAKSNIPLAHVEAGLRSYNKKMPEEINRILTDQLSDILFAPSSSAKNNLINEGIKKNKIKISGDVMLDVVKKYIYLSEKIDTVNKEYILVTIHRQENTDNYSNLLNITSSLIEVSKKFKIIWPLHPRTKIKLKEFNLFGKLNSAVEFLKPQGYLNMIKLQKKASLIVTDSGGLQKEAYFLKTPCVTLREETEWIELVDAKWNVVCPPKSKNKITKTIIKQINSIGLKRNLYGNGSSAASIVSEITKFLINKI